MIPLLLWLYLVPAGIADVDWEVVLSVSLGLGACAVTWLEHRRASKLDETADELRERVVQLEAAWAHAATAADIGVLAERLAAMAVPPDITQLAERTAAIAERLIDQGERLATVESRIDFKPITHTRRKDGKFGRTDEATTETKEPQ